MKITTLDLGEYKPFLHSPSVGAWKFEKKLPLTTETGKIRLIALGVGGAFSGRMYQSNFIVIKGSTVLFVDLGSKTTMKMAEFGLSAHSVKNLLITHSHADHIGSMEEVALKRRYEAPFIEMPKGADEAPGDYFKRIIGARNDGKFRPTLYVPSVYEKILWDWSLRGGLAYSEVIAFPEPKAEMTFDHYFNIVHPKKAQGPPVDTWEFTIPGAVPEDNLVIQTHRTNHIPDSAPTVEDSFYTTGFNIEGRVMVSGDTKFDRETLTYFGEKAEIIFHDCQHFPGGVHASYMQLKELPESIRSKMFLYHLSDGMLDLDVKKDGFRGLMEAAPVVYDF